jgi:hypothetical protein
MKKLALSAVAVAVIAVSWQSTAEGQKGPFGLLAPALVSSPLSINPNEGQPLCLVSNVSTTETIAGTIEIYTGTGILAVNTPFSLPPGTIESATDILPNFFSYCRVVPANSAQLPMLRASHCVASGNTGRSCIEAR